MSNRSADSSDILDLFDEMSDEEKEDRESNIDQIASTLSLTKSRVRRILSSNRPLKKVEDIK